MGLRATRLSRLLDQRRRQRPVAHAGRDSTARTRGHLLSPAASTIALSTAEAAGWPERRRLAVAARPATGSEEDYTHGG
jgi:hypothetical protein